MTPPHDAEAERAVLGALLLGPTPADAADAYASLQVESFYKPAHGEIFAACHELHNEQSEVDEITVGAKLKAQGSKVDAVTVAALTESTPTAANIRHYVRIVREHGMRRKLIAVATSAVRAAQDLETPVTTMLDSVAERVSEIATSQNRSDVWTMSGLVREQFRKLQEKAAGPDEPTGIPTGFYDLDEKLGGMAPGQLLVLAGRPSMGKTSFATAICEHLTTRAQKHVLFVSIEMDREALVQRSLASHARVDGTKLRRPHRLGQPEWDRLVQASAKLDTKNYHGVDSGKLNVLEIRALARLTKARHGLDLIVVDYLQLMRPVHHYPTSREREVAEMSAGLKGLAKELGVPVLVLAQLNRALEQRKDRRPMLSDLRESGAVEQDADVVLFVYRDGYYNADHEDVDAEIIVAKQRSGSVGPVTVGWDGPSTRFFNLQETGRLF